MRNSPEGGHQTCVHWGLWALPRAQASASALYILSARHERDYAAAWLSGPLSLVCLRRYSCDSRLIARRRKPGCRPHRRQRLPRRSHPCWLCWRGSVVTSGNDRVRGRGLVLGLEAKVNALPFGPNEHKLPSSLGIAMGGAPSPKRGEADANQAEGEGKPCRPTAFIIVPTAGGPAIEPVKRAPSSTIAIV